MTRDMEKAELVFIPSPGIGHITSTMEVAKLVTGLSDRFSVTVLVMRLPSDKQPMPESSDPRLRLLELRSEEEYSSYGSSVCPVAPFQFIDDHKDHLREILAEITANLAGIVIDMFCASMIEVADEFGIPSYLFYTSSSAILGLTLHMQSLRDDFHVDATEYQKADAEIVVSTFINPLPAKVLPSAFFEKGLGDIILDQAKQYRRTKGIIINTFQELESHAIQALSNDETVPPVFAIGPLLNLNASSANQNRGRDETMRWLDLQPVSSVVFLCFGSLGSFGVAQVREIAYALEHSGCRFLWSLRKPPPDGVSGSLPGNYENLEEVLPEGFLQRTEEMGKVIGWAPQGAVLSHPAVGGFVSHCGWNSTLESISCGVPMAAWPLYAEQQTNAFFLVKGLEMAVEIKMDYVKTETPEIVSADVIENGIQKLMDAENGIRNKAIEMQRKSRLAASQGGSSSVSMKCFLDKVLDNIP